jgi:hypothetical protein
VTHRPQRDGRSERAARRSGEGQREACCPRRWRCLLASLATVRNVGNAGSGGALPPFPTTRKSTILPAIVRVVRQRPAYRLWAANLHSATLASPLRSPKQVTPKLETKERRTRLLARSLTAREAANYFKHAGYIDRNLLLSLVGYLLALSIFRIFFGCFLAEAPAIRKSSCFLPDFRAAAIQRGFNPRPAQVSA